MFVWMWVGFVLGLDGIVIGLILELILVSIGLKSGFDFDRYWIGVLIGFCADSGSFLFGLRSDLDSVWIGFRSDPGQTPTGFR